MDLRTKILKDSHSSPTGGHAGVKRIMARIATSYYWPLLRQSVQKFVANCPECQQVKYSTSPPSGLLQPLPIPEYVWEDLSMDFITGLPPSGGKSSILVVVDRLTKAAHFVALPPTLNAQKLTAIFTAEIIRLHGSQSLSLVTATRFS